MRAEMPNKRALEDGSSDVRGLADRGVVQITSQINDSRLVYQVQDPAYRFCSFFYILYKNRKGGISPPFCFVTSYSSSQSLLILSKQSPSYLVYRYF